MAVYQYIVRDEDGNREEGTLQAISVNGALEILKKQDKIVVSVKPAKKRYSSPLMDELNLAFERLKERIPLRILVFFTRQLSTMFSAGLTLEKSIKNLASEEKHPRFKKAITRVSSDLQKGSNLSEALSKQPGVFNHLYIALVKAGEVSGSLHTVLGELADYLEAIQDTRRKVISALLYPAVILGFLSVVLTFILLFIIPLFNSVYDRLGASLPGATRTLVGVSEVVSSHFFFILLVVFLCGFILWIMSMTHRGGFLFDLLKLKAPVFGTLIHDSI